MGGNREGGKGRRTGGEDMRSRALVPKQVLYTVSILCTTMLQCLILLQTTFFMPLSPPPLSFPHSLSPSLHSPEWGREWEGVGVKKGWGMRLRLEEGE